ncbi:hypothetical protein MUA48_00750 [Staphylococcus sp. IVB6238]|uniref:hypothetical protein n=1 Tax=Staphylococcus sp. IVB6238 TaxID=2989770 RepID=UPI0021D0488D|nr:hypothetical protein [Staphylococcus sp. IVB6238]UXR74043.1 hypothetical protein MUA48_00750 [Staphylococcus sp. IVB6238]
MKKQSILVGVVASTMILTGCNLLNPNNNGNNNQSGNQNNTQANGQNNQQNTGNSNNAQSNQNTQSNQQNNNNQSSHVYPKNTREYYAQIWLTVRDNIEIFDEWSLTYDVYDVSGNPVNPYNPTSSAILPAGTVLLSSNPTAGGSIIFVDNNDGTITVYDVPSHFQDHRWDEDEFSMRESQKIMNNGQTYQIKNSSESDIAYVANYIMNSTPKKLDSPDLSSSSSSDSDSNDTDSSESSSSSSGTKVTRSNVIDLVEDYEGHYLDTDTYTFKEPEQMPDGRWGFSILDKSGNLVGSYIIDTDGTVTKYDEKGRQI